jgi:hypothetical protein
LHWASSAAIDQLWEAVNPFENLKQIASLSHWKSDAANQNGSTREWDSNLQSQKKYAVRQ